MPDTLSPEQRHKTMAAIHSFSTTPELKLRRGLWNLGFRYKVNDKRLAGRPDIVLPKYQTAIFIHGCFWHGHKGCKNYTVPKTNTDFWSAKIARNQARDQEVWRQLEAQGWAVIIVWECELKKTKLAATIDRVEAEIKRNSETYQSAKNERKQLKEIYRQELSMRKEQEALLKAAIKKA